MVYFFCCNFYKIISENIDQVISVNSFESSDFFFKLKKKIWCNVFLLYVILIVTTITSASDAVGDGSRLHECLTFPACSNRTSQHVKLACEADCVEFFLLDDKNVFLKNKKLLNKNIFKIVDEVSSSESNVRKTRSRVAKISSFPTPMVHQKIIISSTKETDNCEAKSSYQLRHKKQSKPEEKKSESHLQGDIQDKSRNEIGIDIFWHAFFYSGLFGLSLYWLLWVTLLIIYVYF